MKTFSLFAISAIVVTSIVAMPFIVAAQTTGTTLTSPLGLVPCGNGTGPQTDTPYSSASQANQQAGTAGCDFQAFVKMISNITSFLIILSAPIFVIIMVWCGIMFLRYSYTPDKLSTIKKVLWNTLIAFVIILAGWLIVHFIASVLLTSSFNIFNI